MSSSLTCLIPDKDEYCLCTVRRKGVDFDLVAVYRDTDVNMLLRF